MFVEDYIIKTKISSLNKGRVLWRSLFIRYFFRRILRDIL